VSDGEEIMPLAFFVLTQYRRVTGGQTDRQTRCDRYNPRMLVCVTNRVLIAAPCTSSEHTAT